MSVKRVGYPNPKTICLDKATVYNFNSLSMLARPDLPFMQRTRGRSKGKQYVIHLGRKGEY